MKNIEIEKKFRLGGVKIDKINPFSTNTPLLYHLRTLENRMFSDVFRGYWSGILAVNGLNKIEKTEEHIAEH